MDQIDIGWITRVWEFVDPFLNAVWAIYSQVAQWLSELQARYPQIFSPQSLFGLLSITFAIWKWWEAREANLFHKFEEMIARNEAQLVKARNDLLEVMIRPGPGLLIRPPLFVEDDLKRVLAHRKWAPQSLIPLGNKLDERLEKSVRTSEAKVAAHLKRVSLFREEIASARLIQGAVAAGRSAHQSQLFRRQELDQEAFDRFKEVLALPGHREDATALELIAHQLARMDDPDGLKEGTADTATTADAYRRAINVLQRQDETYARNIALARVRRGLALLLYPLTPQEADRELREAIVALMRLGPPRDRHLLELAELTHLRGITRLRLRATVQGPEHLQLARSYYRSLIRSLNSRKRGIYQRMFERRKFSGHRVDELLQRAEEGRAHTAHMLWLVRRRRTLLVSSLQQGSGVRRRNRKPRRMPTRRSSGYRVVSGLWRLACLARQLGGTGRRGVRKRRSRG